MSRLFRCRSSPPPPRARNYTAGRLFVDLRVDASDDLFLQDGRRHGMHINDLLKIAVERKASDLHLKVGAHPIIRVDGELIPLVDLKRLMQEDTIAMAFSIMSSRQKEKFKNNFEIDIAYSVPGLGRFRCNIFQQRGTVGLVCRVIPARILDDPRAPPAAGHREDLRGDARARPRDRDDRVGQVDDAGRDDRLHQRDPLRAHHDDRGPGRVPPPRQEVDRQPARAGGRHALVRGGDPVGAPPGPRRHPRRRNARLRDGRDGPPRGRDRPPRHVDPPHRSTRRRRSTGSSRSSRRTSRSRSACSSRP